MPTSTTRAGAVPRTWASLNASTAPKPWLLVRGGRTPIASGTAPPELDGEHDPGLTHAESVDHDGKPRTVPEVQEVEGAAIVASTAVRQNRAATR